MADARRQPGWPEVVLVAVVVVAVVLGAAFATSLLPTEVQGAIFHGPVLIVVRIVGTGWPLWRISRARPAGGADGGRDALDDHGPDPGPHP